MTRRETWLWFAGWLAALLTLASVRVARGQTPPRLDVVSETVTRVYTIDGGGQRLGLNTNTPVASFHMRGGAQFDNGGLRFGPTGAQSVITNKASEQLYFQSLAGTDSAILFTGHWRVLNNGGNPGTLSLRSADSSTTPAFHAWTNGMRIVDGAGSGYGSLFASNIVLYATTNQIRFGSTNLPPTTTATPTKWVSVQVQGESAVYRMPLYE